MPPQRRKIIPPNTTSKARKKVAGSGRTSPPETGTTPETRTTPVVQEDAATEETATTADTAATDAVATADAASTDVTTIPASTAEGEPASSQAKKSPSLDAPTEESEASSTETDVGGRTNWMPVIVVGVVAAVLIAFALVAALKPGTSVDNAAWVDQGVSSEVTRAGTDGLTALYKYNYETIDDDLAKARDFMGPELQEQTNQFLDAIKSGAQQTQTATDVDVMDIGLTRLESDKAELLANMNVSSTRAGAAYDSVMFPIVVNMEKIDGRWVVSATELK